MKNFIQTKAVFSIIFIFICQVSVRAQTMGSGSQHSLFLCSDSVAQSIGDNTFGQLGIGSFNTASGVRRVLVTGDIKAISVGSNHCMALKKDNTVWTWGVASALGIGNVLAANVPVMVDSISNVKAIEAAYDRCYVLKSDGTVWSWGNNNNGALGNGSVNISYYPVRVNKLDSVIAIAGGFGHGLALRQDGTVWAWGYNNQGQLGDSTLADKNTPVKVKNLGNVIGIACGGTHNLALKSDSTVWAWGSNGSGQLGINSTQMSMVPIQVAGLTSVADVSFGLGTLHSMVCKADGTVWSWGDNTNGQLGINNNTVSLIPVKVTAISNVIEIVCGESNSFARKKDGSIWSWGKNDGGMLGWDFNDQKKPGWAQELCPSLTSANRIAEDLQIKIYPNPSSGKFMLNGNFTVDAKIKIINQLGKIVYSSELIKNTPAQILDISTLPTGIYFAKIYSNGKQILQLLEIY